VTTSIPTMPYQLLPKVMKNVISLTGRSGSMKDGYV